MVKSFQLLWLLSRNFTGVFTLQIWKGNSEHKCLAVWWKLSTLSFLQKSFLDCGLQNVPRKPQFSDRTRALPEKGSSWIPPRQASASSRTNFNPWSFQLKQAGLSRVWPLDSSAEKVVRGSERPEPKILERRCQLEQHGSIGTRSLIEYMKSITETTTGEVRELG